MGEVLNQLKPIAEIVGPEGVRASYSGHQPGDPTRGHRPGRKVYVDGKYKGAHLKFGKTVSSLDDTASQALKQLRTALGL